MKNNTISKGRPSWNKGLKFTPDKLPAPKFTCEYCGKIMWRGNLLQHQRKKVKCY